MRGRKYIRLIECVVKMNWCWFFVGFRKLFLKLVLKKVFSVMIIVLRKWLNFYGVIKGCVFLDVCVMV